VVLAGNGIRSADALERFLRWVRRAGLPVLTTWKSADFVPDDHPLYVGRPGSVGQRGANFAQQNADLLMVVGARLDLPQVGFDYSHFAPRARKVIVDVDQAEIDKLGFAVDVAAAVDADRFLRALETEDTAWDDADSWLRRCKDWQARYPVTPVRTEASPATVDTYAFIDVLGSQLGPEDVLVPGSSGSCAEITMQAFRVKAGQRVFNSCGLGSMGFGLPASIGAAVASGRRVTTIIGDGGLQHNVQELQTVRRLGLPIKIFVLNNGGYASIRSSQRQHFDDLLAADPSSGLTFPAVDALARAYELSHARADTDAELEGVVARVLADPGPVLCELMVDPDLATQPRLASRVAEDGSISSSPLEDLWPFLDRDEFAENMLE
jgi:acetolactate synthase-1/2/3 large subunit